MKVGIILPAYNEERNIKSVIDEARKHVKRNRIVVVDDGSIDKTYEIAKKCGVIALRHKKNLGKGESLKTGIKFLIKSGVEFIVILDADRQYSTKEIDKLIYPLQANNADIVIGQRDWSRVPLRHFIGNFFWRSLCKLFYPSLILKDTNCGFIAMNRKSAKKIVNKIHGGYIVENSIIFAAIENGLKIKPVKVRVTYREKSGIIRGIKIVAGVSLFIILHGIKSLILKIFEK